MLRIAYDGTDYVGWQKQPNGLAVEEVINGALHELTGEQIEVIGASRTDSGVHALGNVAVFDTESRIPGDKFAYALNQRLPGTIVVQESCEVAADFHPRHAECVKTYEYHIYNASHPNPLNARYSYFCHTPLDIGKMRAAAQYLVGEHDFASFCSAGAQVKTTVRTIYSVGVLTEETESGSAVAAAADSSNAARMALSVSTARDRHLHGPVTIRIRGNGFLYNMVRIIAGTLLQVGIGAIPPENMAGIIAAADRSKAGPTAPPEGLTLVRIEYGAAGADSVK